jgi:hypothetical protein
MKFKAGDKVRFKTSLWDWTDYFTEKNLDKALRDKVIADGKKYDKEFGYPITIQEVNEDAITIQEVDGTQAIFPSTWFMEYHEEDFEDTDEYYITEDGFKTCKKNWEKWLL